MIRIDSLLVRALAAALDERYRGRAVRALRLDPANRTASVAFRRETLILTLDPTRPGVHRLSDRPDRMDSVLPAGLEVGTVRALPDERILEWQFLGADDAPRVAIEWLTNRLNALVIGPDDAIRAVLSPREGERRTLTPGSRYELPPATERRGITDPVGLDEFSAVLAAIPPAERAKALLRNIAYTSPLNATAILGATTESAESLADAWSRYRQIVDPANITPCTFTGRDGPQPYPVLLPGVTCLPAPDLFTAFETAGDAPASDPIEKALERIERQRSRVASRIHRLREEADGAATLAARMRKDATLLLSQPRVAPRGTEEAEMDDFEGGTVRVTLDPALGPAENAERLYESARKRDRAAARIPALIREAEAEASRLDALKAGLEAGEVSAADVLSQPAASRPARQVRALPYRQYRTSGGLEVRVGRGARSNDDLTFHHARPDDVWLHARDVGGAHVVLRWESRDANPPARDLHEAAVLAALHSKARTSGLVPVDWTRRKYVRKPRKAPPGRVLVERVKTIFVEPDESVGEAMRVPEV